MPDVTVPRPLNEAHLGHKLGLGPMRAGLKVRGLNGER